MKMRLQKKLIKKYPDLYRGVEMSIKENLMPFGFECGDGWYRIIDDLSERLSRLNRELGMGEVFVTQVKEKFGHLCFYLSSGTEKHYALVEEAVAKSRKTCEICGRRGRLRMKHGWLSTLCDNCWELKRNKPYDKI